MKPTTLLFIVMGLLSLLSGCINYDDRHPDMPLLPQLDNAAIRVDSLANTTVNNFIFSADKTRFYAVVLTASTGVSAQHTLVEYDQAGHPQRQLPLGDMGILQTDLALIQPNALLWKYANAAYIIDLYQFKVIDEVPVYSLSDYPDADKDRATVLQKSRAWFNRKQTEFNKQYGVIKFDSVTAAILEGDTTNAKAYRIAVREARDTQSELELDWRTAYYEAFALKQARAGTYSFGYRSPSGTNEYLFAKFSDGRTAAFTVSNAVAQKSGVSFVNCNLNRASTDAPRKTQFLSVADQAVTDKTSSLQVTETMVTKYNSLLLNGLKNELMLYYELKLGQQTAHVKWNLPLQVSNDFYLQSANGSVYVLRTGVLYWFHL